MAAGSAGSKRRTRFGSASFASRLSLHPAQRPPPPPPARADTLGAAPARLLRLADRLEKSLLVDPPRVAARLRKRT